PGPTPRVWREHKTACGREEEAEAGAEPTLGAGDDPDQLGGAAVTELLAGGAHEALDGALGRRRARVGALARHAAEHDQAAARLEPADRRVEEAPELAQ